MSRSPSEVFRMVVVTLSPIPPDPRLRRRAAVAQIPEITPDLDVDGTDLVIDDIDVTPPAPGLFADDALVAAARLADVEAGAATLEEEEIEEWRINRALPEYLALDPAVFDARPTDADELAALEEAIDDGRGTPAMEERAFVLRRRLGGAR